MISVIDIGSNTIRMKVYKVGGDGRIDPVFQTKDMTGLAGYVGADNVLSAEGIARAAAVLRHNAGIVKSLGLDPPHVFATAALRNAANSERAVREIEALCGMKIDVISGKKEAALDYIGATWEHERGSGVVIDIGGGSTELTFFRDGAIVRAESMPVGSLGMFTDRVEWLLPTAGEQEKIARKTLRELRGLGLDGMKSPCACGVGGSVRACARLAQSVFRLERGCVLPASMVGELVQRFAQPSRESLRRLLRVVPERIHTIMPGMIILHTLLGQLGCDVLEVSAYGVREGYLLAEILHVREVDPHVL